MGNSCTCGGLWFFQNMINFHNLHFLSYFTTISGISGCLEFSLEKLVILICNIFIAIVQQEAKVNQKICQPN